MANTDLSRPLPRYLMMYNANLDKSLVQRKTPARLRLDLFNEEQQAVLAKKREKEKASSTKEIAEDPMKYVVCPGLA